MEPRVYIESCIDTDSAELRKTNLDVEVAVLPEYLKLGDPVLFVGGTASSWSKDFLVDLRVRVYGEITTYKTNMDKTAVAPRLCFSECLPPVLQVTASTLLKEFISYLKLGPDLTIAKEDDDDDLPWYAPLYHDQGGLERLKKKPLLLDVLFHDAWNSTQPWFPLLIE